jgi:hypothetical protein
MVSSIISPEFELLLFLLQQPSIDSEQVVFVVLPPAEDHIKIKLPAIMRSARDAFKRKFRCIIVSFNI